MAFLPLDRHYRHERREILDVRDAFKNAGIKGAAEFVCDANITSDAIVLWAGVRSLDEMGTFSQPPITSLEITKLLAGLD